MNKVIYSLFVMAAFISSFFTGNAKAEVAQFDTLQNTQTANNGSADFYFADVLNEQNNSLIAAHYSHRSHQSHSSHQSHYSSRF